MKKLILISLFIPFAGKAGFNSVHKPSTNLVEVRSGDWPINLEKESDNSYSLQFRDEQYMNVVVMDTLPFADLSQLKYFEQALSVLKTGVNGDIAKFKDYSIKKVATKKDAIWYMLRFKWSLTNFQQPEADIMINAIKNL
jgi:hypothetical protein